MEQQRLHELVQRLRNGTATDVQREELEAFWQQSLTDESVWQGMTTGDRYQLEITLFQAIKSQIRQTDPTAFVPVVPLGRPHWTRRLAAAAVVAGLLLAGGWAYDRIVPADQTVRTAYGERRQVKLPDGSSVWLNGNTMLRYPVRFMAETDRQLWLDGEAYFEVRPQTANTGHRRAFTVHSGPVDVRVLGTGFNVNSRHGTVEVVLRHGAVQVLDRQRTHEVVSLRPGEMVTQRPNQAPRRPRHVDTRLYTSWLGKQIQFYNKPLRDVLALLADNYGLRTVCPDEQLLNDTFSGAIQTDSAALFFEQMPRLFPVKIRREGNTFYLTKQPSQLTQ